MLEGFYLKQTWTNSSRVLLLMCLLVVGTFFFVPTSVSADTFPVPAFVNTGNNPGNINAPGYFAPPVVNGTTPGAIVPVTTATPGGTGGTGDVTGGSPVLNPDGSVALPAPAPENIPAPAVTAGACWESPGAVMNCIVVTGLGGLTAAFGWAFDASIRMFIVDFSKQYIEYGIGNTVESLWITVRDIFNLTFIFGLVYIGFQIILGVNESGARRTIPLLIIAALLVNFSLFITKFIIDFANLAAVQIFNLFQIADSPINASAGNTAVEGAFLAEGEGASIALGFMNQLGVSALLNYDVTDSSPFLYLLGVAVVFIVMIYVFAVGAVLVTIRFAVLIFYMIFSPLMFLGFVFPGFKNISDKFWEGLFGQAFFAPAFIFMLYVTYLLTVGFNDGKRESLKELSYNGADGGVTEELARILPYFILIVIFLLGSLSIARKMANAGSSMVMKVNDWAVGKTRGALVGAGGALAYPMKAGARSGVNAVGERFEKGLNNLQSRSGAAAWLARTNTADRILRGAAGGAKNASLGTGTTNEKERDYRDKTRARASTTKAANDRDNSIKEAEAAFGNTATTADQLNDALEKLTKNLSKMTTEELADLGTTKLIQTHYAAALTDTQLTDLEKSGKMSAADVARIKTAREDGFYNIASAGSAFGNTVNTPKVLANGNQAYQKTVFDKQRSNLASRSVAEIGKMPAKIFKEPDFIQNLTPLMLAERMKNGLNINDVRGIKSILESYLNGNMSVNGTTIAPNQKQFDMWKRWTDNTDRGAEFGLNI